MQLTRFDRWLREVFVYETHIRTLRPAESLPKGIRAMELPASPMQRYKYLYIARSNSKAEALIKLLRENTQMFTTEIVERKRWYTNFISPPDKSFTWRFLSICVTISTLLIIFLWIDSLLKDPEMRKAIDNAIDLFIG